MPRPTPKARKPQNGVRMGPKSFKADGSPKQRWNTSQRSAEGHTPRRAGGERPERPGYQARDDRPRYDRDDRPARSYGRDDRPARSYDRDDRPARSYDRDDRPAARRDDGKGRSFEKYQPRSDAPRRDDDRRGYSRDDRFARPERSEGSDRFARSERTDRFERKDRFADGDRGSRFGRDDRPARDDRSGNDERPRGFRPARPVNQEPRPHVAPRYDRKPWEKPERPQRDERSDRNDRPARSFDRPERSERFDRPDRNERFDRPERSERPARSFDRPERTERPAWGRDERRPAWGRDERPARSFDRDERPARGPRHDDRSDAPDSDMMSWEATDLGEIDDSAVDQEQGFAALGVPSILVAALDKQGITSPFPIQSATIPDAIAGRDVLGRGQTGSGKTLGFGLPMLTRIAANPTPGKSPRGLVLVPTRELALQCADVIAPLAKSLKLDLTLIAGGMSYGPQLKAFDRGVDIVVATPGRLIDLLEQGAVDLSEVLVTVLDEADHMADLGFMPAVTTLLDSVPNDGQRLLFSATLDHAVDRIVRKYLHDPITHEVDSDKATVTTMEHRLLHVLPHDKNAVTAEIANREGRSVLFVRTQMGATRVAEQLRGAGVMAGALHGGLTQGARTRMLAAFKDGTVPVLVATDVAARGIHVDDVSLVLEIDPPMNSKDYLHRAGRTARAGEKGVVASIVLPHQRRTMQRITEQAGVRVEPVAVRPGDETLSQVTGSRVVDATPIEEADFERLISPRKAAPRKGGYQGSRGGGYKGSGGGYKGAGGGNRRGFQGDRQGGAPRRGDHEGWRRDR